MTQTHRVQRHKLSEEFCSHKRFAPHRHRKQLMDDRLRTDEETTRLETPHTEGVEGRRHTPALEQAEQRHQSHTKTARRPSIPHKRHHHDQATRIAKLRAKPHARNTRTNPQSNHYPPQERSKQTHIQKHLPTENHSNQEVLKRERHSSHGQSNRGTSHDMSLHHRRTHHTIEESQ